MPQFCSHGAGEDPGMDRDLQDGTVQTAHYALCPLPCSEVQPGGGEQMMESWVAGILQRHCPSKAFLVRGQELETCQGR